MDCDVLKTAARKLGRQNRLGDGPKVCFRCGYADPLALIPVKKEWIQLHKPVLPRTLFEKDHLVGRNHDPDFIFPICRNCHAEVTELRRQARISMQFEPDEHEREVLRLEALAFLHKDIAAALTRWVAEKRGKLK
jgi:hypothetical protein